MAKDLVNHRGLYAFALSLGAPTEFTVVVYFPFFKLLGSPPPPPSQLSLQEEAKSENGAEKYAEGCSGWGEQRRKNDQGRLA